MSIVNEIFLIRFEQDFCHRVTTILSFLSIPAQLSAFPSKISVAVLLLLLLFGSFLLEIDLPKI